jgi:hypothetical protein
MRRPIQQVIETESFMREIETFGLLFYEVPQDLLNFIFEIWFTAPYEK